MVSQIPSGLMAERLGAKWVMLGYFSVSVLATLLTPIAAKLGHAAVIVARVIAGAGCVRTFLTQPTSQSYLGYYP